MEKEFLEAYEKFADPVFRFSYWRLFEREVAREIMQQTFLKTWEALSSGQKIENLKAFIFRVARNLIIDYQRVKKEKLSLENLLEEGWEPVGQEENLDLKIDLQKIKQTVGELEDIYQEAITLRYLEGFRPKEIAEILGETEDVVSVRIHRGLKKLKILLKENKF